MSSNFPQEHDRAYTARKIIALEAATLMSKVPKWYRNLAFFIVVLIAIVFFWLGFVVGRLV